MTLKLETLLMGEVEIDEKDIIFFHNGLPGFPEYHRWVLAGEEGESIQWLLSVDCGYIALPVTAPELIDPAYAPDIPRDFLNELGRETGEGLTRLAILNLPKDKPWLGTANLLAPVIIDPDSRKGRQIILSDDRYRVHTPLLTPEKIGEIEAARAAEEERSQPEREEAPDTCSS